MSDDDSKNCRGPPPSQGQEGVLGVNQNKKQVHSNTDHTNQQKALNHGQKIKDKKKPKTGENCFIAGTLVQAVKSKGTLSKATPIEQVKCGDSILAANENGTITEQPVIFVTDHEPTTIDFVEITLQSGKRVTPTHNHMMVVRVNG